MKLFITTLLLLTFFNTLTAQEYFTIKQYDVNVTVNKDASLNIDENISVHFTEPRHGIIRAIPYKYEIQALPEGTERAERQLESNGYTHVIIEDVKVDDYNFEVTTEGDYKNIKIGSGDRYVEGDQQYNIHYRMLNAINFFKDHSELYFNIIGNQWSTTIDSVHFTIHIYDALPDQPFSFVATGTPGSKENVTQSKWINNQNFTGHTTQQLLPTEGVTVGISFPQNFLVQQNYAMRGIYWLVLPVIIFGLVYSAWKRWGKDEKVTVQTEYYPPENVSPSISGYLIDDTIDRRDLTALVPYWGAGGYMQVKELESTSMFGLIKNKEYEFIKLKDLPPSAMQFERTLFDGIFETGDTVKLSALKDVLYKAMNKAKSQLEDEVTRNNYYVKGSRLLLYLFIFIGIAFLVGAFAAFVKDPSQNKWLPLGLAASGIITIIFGIFMRKKTEKGTELYRKLLGFKEFIKSVEQDRLREFLKQDEHYFDKVLPYAIVFDVADTWKDKLKGLDIPPPNWYVGNYTTFTTMNFMNSLDHSMNEMSRTFYSAPSSSGSSGGSFGGGGFSGGGFGGGGGSSW